MNYPRRGTIVHLPIEITENILSWLPVKSVTKFRSVCRAWNMLISDPRFVKLHLSRSTETELVVGKYRILDYLDDEVFDLRISEDCPLRSRICDGFVCGSFDGLVCISHWKNTQPFLHTLFLCNPSTEQYNQIPPSLPDTEYNPLHFPSALGFAYNPSSKCYEIVEFRCMPSYSARVSMSVVNVYTVETNLWRAVGNIPYSTDTDAPGEFVCGKLHWRATSCKGHCPCILAYDMGDEMFHEVQLPEFEYAPPLESDWFVDDDDLYYHQLHHPLFTVGTLYGCLCVVRSYTDHVEAWVMKDYGVRGSWTIALKIQRPHDSRFVPLHTIYPGGAVLMLCRGGRELALFDPENTSFTSITKSRCKFRPKTYTKSLAGVGTTNMTKERADSLLWIKKQEERKTTQ